MRFHLLLIVSLLTITIYFSEKVECTLYGGPATILPLGGVNLGHWFCPERWMLEAPIFTGLDASIKDESPIICQTLGKLECQSRYDKLWSTFVNETDFALMKNASINSIRLPISWWMLYDNQAPYPTGGLKWVDQAMAWALKYAIGVIIDVHRVPGQGTWSSTNNYVSKSLDVITFIATRYSNHSCLIGIELINEPGEDWGLLRQYYVSAYNIVRRINPDIAVIYMTWGNSTYLNIQNSTTTNLWNDEHYYPGVFGWSNSNTHQGLINVAPVEISPKTTSYQNYGYHSLVYYGEWALSNSATDTASATFYRDYFLAITKAMKSARIGWTFWAWKTGWGNAVGQVMPWSIYSEIINKNVFASDFADGGRLTFPPKSTRTEAVPL